MGSRRLAPLLDLRVRRVLRTLASSPLIRASFFNDSSNATFRIHRFTTPSAFSGLCQWVHATDEEDDLNQCTDADADALKHILYNAELAASRNELFHTNFLSQPLFKHSLLRLEKLPHVRVIPQGGYPEAERRRLSVGNSVAFQYAPQIVVGLWITGNFVNEPCSHDDFLGAILGTGISRDMLGDIILQGENGAQILVDPGYVSFLVSSLDMVGKVHVICKEIPLHALQCTPKSTLFLTTFESSLKLGAVAGGGFRTPRAKMASLISKGDVRINGTVSTNASAKIKPGDIISIKGSGCLKIGEITTIQKVKFCIQYLTCD